MGKDYYDTLTPKEQRIYDATLEAEVAAKRLERPDRNGAAKEALKRLLEAMERLERDYHWENGKLVLRAKKKGNP